jgi:hypothetical protein
MNSRRVSLAALCIEIIFACFPAFAAETTARVQLVRTPNGGIQPQAMTDASGAVHLVYFKGEAKGGDLFYVRQSGDGTFSKPIQINSIAGSAIAAGTIRGAHLAIGKSGRIHVAWNGSKSAPNSTHKGVPMWYARLNDAGTAFEAQRDLMQFSASLDGGGSIAADSSGNVYALWHAAPDDNTRGEEQRALYLARSKDDGKTFTRERKVNPRETGACACCGVRAFVGGTGELFALYRAAAEKVNRDETLIVSRNQGESFEVITEHRWKAAMCPMSSASFAGSTSGNMAAAWETADQVYFAKLQPTTLRASTPIAPPGMAKRKHPSVATAGDEVLLAWTEGTGWQKGGSVAWQIFDATGSPTEVKGRAPGVPVWGLVAAVAKPDKTFVIYY